MLRKMSVTAGQKDVQLLSLASNYGGPSRAPPTAGGNSNLNFVRSTPANCDFSPIKKRQYRIEILNGYCFLFMLMTRIEIL